LGGDGKTKDSELGGSKHSQISSAFSLFMNAISVCYFQIFELCHIFKGFISSHWIILSCILV